MVKGEQCSKYKEEFPHKKETQKFIDSTKKDGFGICKGLLSFAEEFHLKF